MSAEKFLVTGATGRTGRDTVQRLVEKGHAVRALIHKEDARSEALRGTGAEVVVGDSWSMTTPSERRPAPAPPISAIRSAPGSSRRRPTSRTRPSAQVSRPLSTCRRSLPAGIPRATRRAITGSPNASLTGRAFRSCISVQRSSRSGCFIPFRGRPLSKRASSICPMAKDAMLR